MFDGRLSDSLQCKRKKFLKVNKEFHMLVIGKKILRLQEILDYFIKKDA